MKDRDSDRWKKYGTYCTGCGLCHSMAGIEMKKSASGFLTPNLERDVANAFCSQVCPACGKHIKSSSIWGEVESACYGWSADQELRWKASSGGALSAIAISLLENHWVDGIIQIKQSDESVIRNKTVVSRSKADVIACCGSRYSISSPLMDLDKLVSSGDKYCFIGKPCDAVALRNFMRINKSLNDRIPIILSFFCAGIPSDTANHQMLKALNTKDSDAASLCYRGRGWPGCVTLIRKDGGRSEMTYEDAWGNILGRDVNKACRFCVDGIGESADIVCGDGWYALENGSPDFRDHEGRNIIISRTSVGEKALRNAAEKGNLHIEKALKESDLEELKNIQRFQYIRKATMLHKFLAMKICGKTIPDYPFAVMRGYAQNVPFKVGLQTLAGTFKRIWNGKI